MLLERRRIVERVLLGGRLSGARRDVDAQEAALLQICEELAVLALAIVPVQARAAEVASLTVDGKAARFSIEPAIASARVVVETEAATDAA